MRYIEPHFQSLPALSGRPVKQAAGVDNISLVIHEDFSAYPASVPEQLKGAVGCLKALGMLAGQFSAG